MGALKIAAEPTAVGDPGIRPLDDPSPGEHMKAFGHDLVPVDLCSFGCPDAVQAAPGMVHNLQANPQMFFHPVLEWRTCIPAIRPDHLETRHLSDQRQEQHFASCSISDLSGQHFDRDEQTLRVHEQMPFSALNFFSPRRNRAHRHERNWF